LDIVAIVHDAAVACTAAPIFETSAAVHRIRNTRTLSGARLASRHARTPLVRLEVTQPA
jgi:hypothetical protein